MAHLRQRFLQQHVLKTLSWSPAVGIYGLRQVGKSTLVNAIVSNKNGIYESFDRDTTLQNSKNRPREFCDRPHLLCIDECQKGPWIFPVIKDLIGIQRKPGRFLLTGSLRFTLKKEIREALTGRIVLFELLPFTLAEATRHEPSSFLSTCFESLFHKQTSRKNPEDKLLVATQQFLSSRKFNPKQITRHILQGGLPIPCFGRNNQTRKQWYSGFFETLISRDLALVDPGLTDILPAQAQAFLKRLALMQGEDLNYSQLAIASTLSLGKAKRFLRALVTLCLIDLVVPEAHAVKSQRKMRVEWKDSGLWNHFVQLDPEQTQDHHTAMTLFLSQELRFQLGLLQNNTQWSCYKSHNGANIPWIFRQGDKTLALIYLPMETPTPYHYRALKQFVAHTPNSHGIILCTAKAQSTAIDKGILMMPLASVL